MDEATKERYAIQLDRIQRLERQLRQIRPTLMLYTSYIGTRLATIYNGIPIPLALTDFENIYYNPFETEKIDDEELRGLIAHERLHVILEDNERTDWRDSHLHNVAADYRINAMVENYNVGERRELKLRLPRGGLINPAYAGLSCEEIYELEMEKNGGDGDGASGVGRDLAAGRGRGNATPGKDDISIDVSDEELADQKKRAGKAREGALAAMNAAGLSDPELERAIQEQRGNLPWEVILRRFMSPTSGDFTSMRRSLIHRRLYMEDDITEGVETVIFIDTSVSMKDHHVALAIAEVQRIISILPVASIKLYYGDIRLYGPYDLKPGRPFPTPKGGGGTDFRPMLRATPHAKLRVMITDGRGTYPAQKPGGETLWIITPGGIPSSRIPFGYVARMANSAAGRSKRPATPGEALPLPLPIP